MRFPLLVCLMLPVAAPAAARTLIGRYGDWATFCDGPRRCFAIAQPNGSARGGYLAIVYGGGAIMLDAGQPLRSARLTIGADRFALAAGGNGARVDDGRAARAIVAAIRSADAAVVEARTARGTRLRQRYRLRGAPSAIDAAQLAALR